MIPRAWWAIGEVDLFCRALVATVFLVAGAAKLFRPRLELQQLIRDYRLVPRRAVPALAAILPWAELTTAVGLAFDLVRPVPAIAAVTMLLAFSGAVAVNMARGRRHISCGCFGSLAPETTLSWTLLARNVVLAGLALQPTFPAPSTDLAPGDSVAVLLLVAAALVIGALVQVVTRMLRLSSAPSARSHEPRRTRTVAVPHQHSSLLAIEMGREPD